MSCAPFLVAVRTGCSRRTPARPGWAVSCSCPRPAVYCGASAPPPTHSRMLRLVAPSGLRSCLQEVQYLILWGKDTTSYGSYRHGYGVSAVRDTRGVPKSQPGTGSHPEGGVLAASVLPGIAPSTMETNTVTNHLAPIKRHSHSAV